MFALVDSNNFYVSCERLFAPRLEGQPVGVLSNNDGCVIARSEEFKALGIPMGMPTHKIAPDLRRQVVLCSSNYALYGDISARIQQVLAARVPALEPYSIDECFLDLRGVKEDLETLGRELAMAVAQEVGMPVSVGIAPTRTLAKLANRHAKRHPARPQVCVWPSADTPALIRLLDELPLNGLWGIGERLQRRLAGQNIVTAAALRDAPQEWLRKHFSVVVARLAKELTGTPCLQGTDIDTPRRSILCSRSFARPLNDPGEISAALRYHSQRAGEKLRRDDLQASALGLFLRTSPYQYPDRPGGSLWAPLPYPSADTLCLNRLAQALLARLWDPSLTYQKVGVMLSELTPRQHSQGSLFQGHEPLRQEKLMATWDTIRQRFGNDALTLGVHAADARWQMHSRYRSSRYTTRWDELPGVSAC
ncbi:MULTISPECIES: Y-family DNA polymerase [Halomonadaceae]|uniref:Y-family DNA polymerase n=1 Tax=Halomonadaceae TaxID=28256 RepID=UPI00159A7B66|nr:MULTISPECIES: Y-family DNA polymerase [Halomonas]QJQ95723.1 Y-family DNA polymerase [Halomonas sp. PA5]